MTPEEIDVLVAEKVMGWKRLTYAEANPKLPGYANHTKLTLHWHDSNLQECALAEYLYDYYSPENAWSPSYAIADAWEVVERLLSFNPFWNETDNLYFDLSPTKPKGWQCNFGDDNTRAYAATAPMAICLAALKCAGVSFEE